MYSYQYMITQSNQEAHYNVRSKGKYLTPQRSCQPAETPLRTRRTHCGTGSRGRRRHQRSLSPCIARWPQSLPQGTCKRCSRLLHGRSLRPRRTEASRPARTRSTRLRPRLPAAKLHKERPQEPRLRSAARLPARQIASGRHNGLHARPPLWLHSRQLRRLHTPA